MWATSWSSYGLGGSPYPDGDWVLVGLGSTPLPPSLRKGEREAGEATCPDRWQGLWRGSDDFYDEGAEVGPGGDGGVVADARGGGEGGGDLDGAAGGFKGPGFADVLAVAQAVAARSQQAGEIDRYNGGGIPVEDGQGAEPAFGFGERDDAGQRSRQRDIGKAGGIQGLVQSQYGQS